MKSEVDIVEDFLPETMTFCKELINLVIFENHFQSWYLQKWYLAVVIFLTNLHQPTKAFAV